MEEFYIALKGQINSHHRYKRSGNIGYMRNFSAGLRGAGNGNGHAGRNGVSLSHALFYRVALGASQTVPDV
ncbi:hypothetical protein C1J05_15105 [Sulfitobacter sp. JL08]|uniref:hypothetical protein n=1 Tax=Sulfitobacter sp. JL08 TaxID=2070369 RepID=UPI000E0C2A8B|nr:hypothetical protein [Sulfitobacter sp. JL08]AXI55656.1 hypothetical protein C1J05_15105 [Sulfitobacter sp. JL08]